MALVLLSGSAVAQERRFPPDGCCIPQDRQALRAETRAGQCLSDTLKRMSCPEVYARFNQTHARINESSLNQFGRLNGSASVVAPALAPAPAAASPLPPTVSQSTGASPSVPSAAVLPPFIKPLPVDPANARSDELPMPK